MNHVHGGRGVKYEVPEADADLLEVGCVLSPERLVEVWSHNEKVRRETAVRNRKLAAQRKADTLRRHREYHLSLRQKGFGESAIRRMARDW